MRRRRTPRRWNWLSSFTRRLPDARIDTTVERFASTRVGPGETAVPHRDPGWNLLLPSAWTDPADTGANLRWTRETHADLQPHLSARRWLNDLGDNQGDAATNRRATRTSETHTRQ